MRRTRLRAAGALAAVALGLTLGLAGSPTTAEAAPTLSTPTGQLPQSGNTTVHDPTLIYDEAAGLYILADSHNAIRTGPTKNGPWTVVGSVTRAPWTQQVPNSSTLWAPHLQKIDDTFYYYYSQSSFGSSTSAIGVKTTKTPAIPSSYVDLGRPVVASGALAAPGATIEFNAIDPVTLQDADGDWWMVWGSFWDGIVVQQLGEDHVSLVGEPTLVASRQADDNPIEAPSIFYRDGYYYLVASWDKCCSAASSTYKVVVGRSESITGPYVDQAGMRMDEGGGTVVLDSRQSAPGVTPAGLYRAPGGADVYTEDGTTYLVYHAYRPQNTLGIRPFDWYDGWPYFAEPGGGSYDLTDGSHLRLVSEARPFTMPEIDRVAGRTGFGTALKLNGGSPAAWVDLPDGVVSTLDGDYTISMWVNRRSTAGQNWSRLWDFGDSSSNFMFLSPQADATPRGLRFETVTADGRNQMIPGTGDGVTIPVGWQHVAVTASGTTGTLWVNGVAVRTNTNFTLRPADLGFTENNRIGRSQFATDPWLNAEIDDFNIFSRALDASGVAALMAAPGGGEAVGGGDVVWYEFDEAGGTAVLDSSESGNDATAVVPVTTEDQLQNPVKGTQCLSTVTEGGVTSTVQRPCDTADRTQTWRLDAVGGGSYQLASHASRESECLTLADDSGAVGTPIVLEDCDAGNELQHWFLSDASHGHHKFVSTATNLTLEIENTGGIITERVLGGDRGNRPIANLIPAQQWLIEHVDVVDRELAVEVSATSRCLGRTPVVAVTATNADTVALGAVTLAMPSGSREFASLAPGKRASNSFSVRATSVAAGEATVTTSAVVDGEEITFSESVPFDAITCS